MQRPFLASIVASSLVLSVAIPAQAMDPATPVQSAATEAQRPIDTKILIRLARRGHTQAQRMLGDRFERGNGVQRNYETAAKWYTRAARSGDVVAQRNLGYLHESGLLGEENHAEAAKWYLKAAKQGDPEAQRSLAYIYESGLAGKIDEIEAAKWLDRAAGRRTSDPAEEISEMEIRVATAVDRPGGATGNGNLSHRPIAASLTQDAPRDVTPGNPLDIGLEFNRHHPAAREGDLHAQYRLGIIFLKGQGVRPNYEKARKWLYSAAEGGYARAQAALGAMYAHGVGAEQDTVQAYFWFKLAAPHLPPGRTHQMAQTFRRDAERRMTPEQRAEAQQLSREWRTEIVPATAR